jgi:hypothetical protein
MVEELDNLLFEYTLKFGDGFPTFQLFRGLPTDECVKIVRRCLDENKTAYELGLVTASDDVQY